MSESPLNVQSTNRPIALPVQFDQLPRELKERQRWVVWEYRWEDSDGVKPGRWAKPPLNPYTNRLADVNDQADWGTSQAALSAYNQNSKEGIGYALGDGPLSNAWDHTSCIDLDKCRDPETEVIAPWAREIIDLMDSYTEVSPSRTGVHIFFRSRVLPPVQKRGNIEIYVDRRYICMTGHRIEGTPAEVEYRQEQAVEFLRRFMGPAEVPAPIPAADQADGPPPRLSDEEVLVKVRRAGNGAKFRRLWDATRETSGNASNEDFQFLLALAYYTDQDADQLERLWRMAPRWGIHSDREGYVKLTITKAIQSKKQHWSADEAPARAKAAHPGNNGQIRPYCPRGAEDRGAQVGGLEGLSAGMLCGTSPPAAGGSCSPPDTRRESSENSSTPPPVPLIPPPTDPPAAEQPALPGRVASTVKEGKPDWFVKGWVPRGCVSFVIGRPSVGKSSWLASLMVKAKRTIIFPGEEESIEEDLLPRLRAHGVNKDNVRILDTEAYSLGLHSEEITRIARAWKADLIVFDPIDSYMGDDCHENDGPVVRKRLEKASKIARVTRAAVIATRHPGQDPKNLMPGSRQWAAVPRRIIELLEGGGNPERRMMRIHKPRGCMDPPPIYFDVVKTPNGDWVFTLGDAVPSRVLDLARNVPDDLDRLGCEHATEMLKAFLADGKKAAKEVHDEAKKEQLNLKTVQRAAKSLGVQYERTGCGKDHACFWFLPGLKDPSTRDTTHDTCRE